MQERQFVSTSPAAPSPAAGEGGNAGYDVMPVQEFTRPHPVVLCRILEALPDLHCLSSRRSMEGTVSSMAETKQLGLLHKVQGGTHAHVRCRTHPCDKRHRARTRSSANVRPDCFTRRCSTADRCGRASGRAAGRQSRLHGRTQSHNGSSGNTVGNNRCNCVDRAQPQC